MKEGLFRKTLVLVIVVLFVGTSGVLTITGGNEAIDSMKTAGIAVTKTPDVIEGYPGDIVNYTIVVTNTGDETLYDVYVNDTTLGISYYIESLAAGESKTYYVEHTPEPEPDPFVNCVEVEGYDELGERYSDTDCASVDVCYGTTDIDIEKYVTLDSSRWYKSVTGHVGDTVYFKLVITNVGDVIISGSIVVKDILPSSLVYSDNAFVSYGYGDSWTHPVPREPDAIVGNTIYWNFTNSLDPGYGIRLTFDTVAVETGSGVNIANVTANGGVYDEDYASVTILEYNPEVSLIKEVYNETSNSWEKSVTVIEGDDVSFRIRVGNTGNVVLHNIHIEDDLPSFLTYNTGSSSEPLSVESPHHLEWDLGNLAVGQIKTITFTAHATSSGEGDNIATVDTDEGAAASDSVNVEVKNVQTVKILSVPYIHQCYDTPDDFVGSGACAPTSAIMLLAYYNRIQPKPIEVSHPDPHISDYGVYISREYTYDEYTFDKVSTADLSPCGVATGAGAWGWIWQKGVDKVKDYLLNYLTLHDFYAFFWDCPSKTLARTLVRTEIDNGRPVIARTYLTKCGHYVVIRGYEIDSQGNFWYLVNDPFGDEPYGDGCWGEYNVQQPVKYSYSQMKLGSSSRGLIFVYPLDQEEETYGHLCYVCSPVNLHAIDEYGRHVGINETGDIEIQIPEAEYSGPDAHPQWIAIYNNSLNVTFYAVGIETGTFDMVWERIGRKSEIYHFTNVSTNATTTAYLHSIQPNVLEVDENGDGNIDTTFVAPFVNFTYYPLWVSVNRTITFNASNSCDSDGSIVSYRWDFGDGTTSDEQNPIHAYTDVGVYTVNLTLTDNDNIKSTVCNTVAVSSKEDNISPTVQITKPKKALYIKNNKIVPFLMPVIVGNIEILVNTLDDESGINRVEFHIDNKARMTDTTEPYSWTWDEGVFGKHLIKVIAYDNAGNHAAAEILVWKFF